MCQWWTIHETKGRNNAPYQFAAFKRKCSQIVHIGLYDDNCQNSHGNRQQAEMNETDLWWTFHHFNTPTSVCVNAGLEKAMCDKGLTLNNGFGFGTLFHVWCADDIFLFGSSADTVVQLFDSLVTALAGIGLRTNPEKSGLDNGGPTSKWFGNRTRCTHQTGLLKRVFAIKKHKTNEMSDRHILFDYKYRYFRCSCHSCCLFLPWLN